MFNLDFEVFRFQERGGPVENGQQLARTETVLRVIRTPRLQTAREFGAELAATVNETFVNPRDFGDVRLGWHLRAGGQLKPDIPFCMFA